MTSSSKPVKIDLNIGDQLTSISCSHIVVEIIKFIVYQRLQIPYTYQWLKHIVNKKKEYENVAKDSFQSEKHFHTVSSALENLDVIMKSVSQEINSAMPQEVCIVLGSTPVTCKEVYRLMLPPMCHKPQCHSNVIASDQKIQQNVFQTLVTSECLNQVFFNSLPPTNMFAFIRKKVNSQDYNLNNDYFVPASGCRIPNSSKLIVIDFRRQKSESVSCCTELQVFGDVIIENLDKLQIDDMQDEELREIESNDAAKWFQSCYVMKGFKDCIVNGKSITNTWLEV